MSMGLACQLGRPLPWHRQCRGVMAEKRGSSDQGAPFSTSTMGRSRSTRPSWHRRITRVPNRDLVRDADSNSTVSLMGVPLVSFTPKASVQQISPPRSRARVPPGMPRSAISRRNRAPAAEGSAVNSALIRKQSPPLF